MHLTYRNVNFAFRDLVMKFRDRTIPIRQMSSRNGPVLMIDEPVTITYTHPTERVLINPARDCNPFFHLYEAIWMVAGCQDVEPVAFYAKRMKQFSDDGHTLNGAYGYRWRYANEREEEVETGIGIQKDWKTVDQLQILIDHLKAKPDSRRAVLQMWNVEDDLLKIDSSKDVCCNTSAMFSLRDDSVGLGKGPFHPDVVRDLAELGKPIAPTYLDMTVTNRSNDLIWGLLGANVVHFSFLQEYMAARLGVQVGVYNHFTNNLHVYTESNSWFKPDEWLAPYTDQFLRSLVEADGYRSSLLGSDPLQLDRDLRWFATVHGTSTEKLITERRYETLFLQETAVPMLRAFRCYKFGDHEGARIHLGIVKDDYWRLAGSQWLEKRGVPR